MGNGPGRKSKYVWREPSTCFGGLGCAKIAKKNKDGDVLIASSKEMRLRVTLSQDEFDGLVKAIKEGEFDDLVSAGIALG